MASSPGTHPSQTLLRSHIVGQLPVPAAPKPGGDVYNSTRKINGAVSIKRKERKKKTYHTLTQQGGGALPASVSSSQLDLRIISSTYVRHPLPKEWDQRRRHEPAETSEEDDKCTRQSLSKACLFCDSDEGLQHPHPHPHPCRDRCSNMTVLVGLQLCREAPL